MPQTSLFWPRRPGGSRIAPGTYPELRGGLAPAEAWGSHGRGARPRRSCSTCRQASPPPPASRPRFARLKRRAWRGPRPPRRGCAPRPHPPRAPPRRPTRRAAPPAERCAPGPERGIPASTRRRQTVSSTRRAPAARSQAPAHPTGTHRAPGASAGGAAEGSENDRADLACRRRETRVGSGSAGRAADRVEVAEAAGEAGCGCGCEHGRHRGRGRVRRSHAAAENDCQPCVADSGSALG
eukprot:scaffold18900_cov101-Isochrysis_galbana.AAC.6